MKHKKDGKTEDDAITSVEDEEYLLGLNELQRELVINARFEKIKNYELQKNLEKLCEEKSQTQKNERQEIMERPTFVDCDFLFTRDFIIKNVFKPFFNKFKGCFVRAAINDRHYICKIVGVEKVPKYMLFGKTKLYCSIGLNLDTGVKVIKGLQINSISSSNSLEEEFNDFISTFSISCVQNLRTNFRNVKAIFERSMTDAEITQFLKNRTDDNPVKKTNTQRKIEIIAKRDEAIQAKNKEMALSYQKQLEMIEDEERSERRRKMNEGAQIHRKNLI